MKVTKLLGNRIQVKPLPQDEKASDHVFYAQQYKPEQMIHEVLAVGTGRKLKNGTVIEIPVKAGDQVLLDQYALNDRTDAGDGSWIVNLDACNLVVESTPNDSTRLQVTGFVPVLEAPSSTCDQCACEPPLPVS